MIDFLHAGVLGDTHFPWVDRRALDKAIKLLRNDMTHVVQIGDLFDWYSASRFPRSHNIIMPEEETAKGRKMALEMWARVKDKCPYAKLVQLMGNHCDRPLKRASAFAPEIAHLVKKEVDALYTFPGVTTIRASNEDFKVRGVVFAHGFLPGLGDHARAALCPVVRGHSHKGGTVWVRPGLWELDVGYLGDSKAQVFGYQAWRRAYKMTVGMGIVDGLGPRFVPL